jgi:hypothetical protein
MTALPPGPRFFEREIKSGGVCNYRRFLNERIAKGDIV